MQPIKAALLMLGLVTTAALAIVVPEGLVDGAYVAEKNASTGVFDFVRVGDLPNHDSVSAEFAGPSATIPSGNVLQEQTDRRACTGTHLDPVDYRSTFKSLVVR